jgi:hypothetical protein
MPLKLSKIVAGDEIKYFKQINLYKTLSLPYRCLQLDEPIDVVSKIDIISAKFIDTPQGTSIEGQHLTGKKLIVLGNLNTRLFLRYTNCKTKVFLKEDNIQFSTFIIVPKQVCEAQPIDLRYLIEDVTVKAIEKYKVLVSATILFQFVHEYIDFGCSENYESCK